MKRIRRTLLSLVAAQILICSTTAFAQSTLKYTLVDLGLMGGTASVATGINNNGQITGYIDYADGHQDCFLLTLFVGVVKWSSSLHFPLRQHNYCVANAINQNGEVAGSMYVQTGTTYALHGFHRTASGTIIDLPPLNNSTSEAYGLNDNGIAVGQSNSGGQYPLHTATMWDAAGHGTNLAYLLYGNDAIAFAIDSHGMMIGQSNDTSAIWGTQWYPNGVTVALPMMGPYGYNIAYRTNNNGLIAGVAWQGPPSYTGHVVLWRPGWHADLGTLSGYEMPTAVSSDNWVLGTVDWKIANFLNNVFVYSPSCSSLYRVRNLLDSSGTGWYLSSGWGMNDSHWIVGSAWNGVENAILLIPDNSPLCFPA